MAKINIKNVIKKYGKLEVVKGINLNIQDGEFVVLVGPSGCGKSTTLRMVTGLEKINGGDVYIGERRVNDLTPRERNVAMVFQNYALYPHMNVRDNLSFSLKIAKEDAKTIKERVDEASNILGLDKLLDRLPANLSGGQRQRVAMGRAIVRKPDVFLFDEPLSNLDAKLRTKMRTEIKKLHNKIGTTIVYVTHDQVEAMSLADRVVIMQDGNIEQVGTPMEVFLKPVNIFVAGFIGTPAMNFFEGLVVKKSLKLLGGDEIALPNQVSEVIKEGQKVVMGIRPENIHLKSEGLKKSIKIKVKPILVEPMGSETLVVFNYNGGEQVAKIIATELNIDLTQERDFFLDINRLYFFDLTTGKTLV